MSAVVEEKLAFACGGCGATLRVPRRLAGVKGPCPKCGVEITAPKVPDPSGDSADASAAAEAVTAPSTERKREPSKKPAPQTKKAATERRRDRKKKALADAPALPGLEPLMDEASEDAAAEKATATPDAETQPPKKKVRRRKTREKKAARQAEADAIAPAETKAKAKAKVEPESAESAAPESDLAAPNPVAASLSTSPEAVDAKSESTAKPRAAAHLPAEDVPEGVKVNESTGWIELPADEDEEPIAPKPLGAILASENTERVQRSVTEPIGGESDRSPVAIPLDFNKLLQSPGGKSFVNVRAFRRQFRRLNHVHPAVLAGGGSLVILLLALLVFLPGSDEGASDPIAVSEAEKAFSEPATTGPVAVENDRDLPETNLAMLSPEPLYSRAQVGNESTPMVADPIAEDIIVLPSRQELEEAMAAAESVHSGTEDATSLEGELSEPRAVLERYFSLPTWKERLPLTYRGEQLRETLAAHYAEHPDGAMPSGYQLEFFFVEESNRQGGPFYSYYLIEDNQSRPVPVVVRMTPDGPKVDWELFVEMRDRRLEDYLSRPEERAPGDFRVILRRASYWGPERQKIARLEDYISFSVNLPFADDLAYVLVKKDSQLGKDLADEINWSSPPNACTVRLEWMNLEGGARVLLLQEQLASGWHLDS